MKCRILIVPGSVQIGLGGQYATWAAIVLGLEAEIIIVAGDDRQVSESRLRLARVGIEHVVGYIDGGIAGWTSAGLPVEQTQQISVQQLHDLAAGIQIVDVRRAPEWQSGHVAGALHKPLDKLASTLASTLSDLDATRSLAVYCKIAASLLQRAGFEQVMNVTGGFDAWRTCDLPFVVEQHAATAAQ